MKAFLVLGNQLFPTQYFHNYKDCHFFMAEDIGLCTHFKYHKHKIILFLSAMRHFKQEMTEQQYKIHYESLSEAQNTKTDYFEKLKNFIEKEKITRFYSYEIEDKFFEKQVQDFFNKLNIEYTVLTSPFFLTTRQEFSEYLKGVKKPFMKTFYEKMRKKTTLLMEGKTPIGGQYSFDADNRKKLPKKKEIPQILIATPDDITKKVTELTDQLFSDHPGEAQDFWLPVTRKDSWEWFENFLSFRFQDFGNYQDAITDRDPFVFHSLISPMVNLGLMLPGEISQKACDYGLKNKIPMNSIEGFIRQVIGWREFVRGVYQNYSEVQDNENFFQHTKKIPKKWYQAQTQIPVLDDAIKKAYRYGYNHHIERLMVMGNMMVLLEIDPGECHEWFMQMYVDSSDWVMGPNVYGMALFSDGGVFATKPYICGGNYYKKMSDYPKGEWVDTVNALYWRFISKHLEFFKSQYRLSMMARMWERMDKEKQREHLETAEYFIQRLWSE